MNKKKNKRIIAGVLSLALALCATIAGAAVVYQGFGKVDNVVNASITSGVKRDVAWSDDNLKESYEFLSKFTVPARTLTVGDQNALAESVVIYPDGTATKNKEINLDQSGLYEIRYTAVIGGKTYYENVEFTVEKHAYYCTGSGESKVEYRSEFSTKFPHTWWNNDNTTTTKFNDFKKAGLLIELKQGDKFECAKLIDVSNLKKSDLLFGVTAIPYVQGVCDFERLDFVLTDSVDPSISLKIRARGYLNEGDVYPYTWILAGGQNQSLKGYEASKQLIHVNDEWGTPSNHSFYGYYTCPWGTLNDPEAHQILKLYYDNEENAVYTQFNEYRTRSMRQVVDLDDPQFFSDPWSGFPSGKVKLSIEAGVYTGETARFLVSTIAGLDLSEIEFDDTDPPEITIDNDYEAMPKAIKGGTYPIPAATAFDVYTGKCEVKTSVWYNYGQSNAVNVQISNGRFPTALSGTYAIVYETKDAYGTPAKKVLWVECEKELPAVGIEFYGDYKTACHAGERVDLAAYTLSGGSGDIDVIFTATVDDVTETVGASFIPRRTGTYKISYVATDYLGRTAKASYNLTVTASEHPIFGDTPTLPVAYISGTQYVIPALYADDYSSGEAKKVAATVKVTDGNGEKIYNAGEVFTPNAGEDNSLTLEFAAGGPPVTYIVPCVSVRAANKLLAAENYFTATDVVITKDDTGIILTTNGERGEAAFINSVLAETFNAELMFSNSDNVSEISVTLTDSQDKNVSATARLVRDGSSTRLITSGKNVSVTTAGFGLLDKSSSLTYSDGAFILGGNKATVTKTDNGAVFNGFPSGKVNVRFTVAGTETNSAIKINSINGQTLSSKTALDFVAPEMHINGVYGGSHEVGTLITLPAVNFADVLDPNAACTMIVTDPDGNTVTDITGKTLNGVTPDEYVVKLHKTGVFTVRYTAKDTSGNTANRVYSIKAEDVTSPTIEIKGEWKSGKVGEVYKLPEIVAIDESGEASVRIMVLDPKGFVTVLKKDVKSVKFATAGRHAITIVARDKEGNTTSTRVFVDVNE